MLSVWTAVKVVKQGAEREGQAGTVHASSPEHPEEVVVKFDQDNALVSVPVADLQAL